MAKPKGSHISLGGYAGTGKTTLVAELRRRLKKSDPNKRVAFASFTGKAAQVLRSTLEAEKVLLPDDRCGTIHSMLYSPDVGDDGELRGWRRAKAIRAELIVIDEASMVTSSVWRDLGSFGIPIIAVGDHGQLPPVGGSFNLMERPDLRLEHIHRQAKGNPIIEIARAARETGEIAAGQYGHGVMKMSWAEHEPDDIRSVQERLLSNFHDDMLVLCGRNRTRNELNQAIRLERGAEGPDPEVGEQVVCLKNSYAKPEAPIYNGMVGKVSEIRPKGEHWFDAVIDFPSEGRQLAGLVSRHQFGADALIDKVEGVARKEIGERFDYGYALTVHKAQGSQAKTVLLFEERFQKMDDDDWRRWLYTAVTRARENLYIIGP